MSDGWTRADQAELDAILWFWLERHDEHRAECQECQPRMWCDRLSKSWDAVEAWLYTRRRMSRAEHLRACRNLIKDSRKGVRPGLDRHNPEAHNGTVADPDGRL